ncbi:DEAD/DEAH box helicase [Helicovermis profundi]|uniref:DEAD/DEAH box helicase n=1 Tax=Helicovermis profundi TaxID=3065157 RepID=A0AAU9EEL7_9FIRM|nr:DEAD/DEAH box helicase [Clostridia bacterium S502]
MKFKNLNISSEIKHALSDLGFTDTLKVQESAFESIIDEKDLIVMSQTGSGKTAAFAIPIIEKIDMSVSKAQAIILVPTRELALQVKEDFDDISKYKNVKSIALYGKEDMQVQRKKLKIVNHVIVSTPGRLMDHLIKGNVNEIKYLVIDEADEMLIMGFIEQIRNVIKRLPKERTTLLFSATISEKTEELASEYMSNPKKILIESNISPIDKIEQIYYKVPGIKKVDFLKKMLKREEPRKCIVFCNTRDEVINLYRILNKFNSKVCALHGGMKQEDRFIAYRDFKKNKYNILIATDVSSRGIHIQGVTHVVNYYVPFETEQYVHRIGRTGRVDKSGVAITFVSDREMERFEEIEEFIGYKIPLKGGYIEKKTKRTDDEEVKGKRKKFKDNFKNKKRVQLELNVGRANSKIKVKDITFAVGRIKGVDPTDLGQINISAMNTRFFVLNGKEELVLKALKNKEVNGNKFRIKKVNKKRR